MTVQQKASKLYTAAYTKWCYELSHEKNYLTAKDICLYICKEVVEQWEYVDTHLADLGGELNPNLKYWNEVKTILEKSNHNELYKTYEQ